MNLVYIPQEQLQLKIRKCGIMGVLEIIEKKYFLEDILDWIVNLKFRLSNISGCRDIADQEFTDQNLNCYIFIVFYATELKLSEIEE